MMAQEHASNDYPDKMHVVCIIDIMLDRDHIHTFWALAARSSTAADRDDSWLLSCC